MNLHVVAYPELAPADYEMIQLCRRDHNSLFKVIEPHFTIVFSVPDMDAGVFIEEIKKQVGHAPSIPFCLRCAVINKDSFSNNFDAFLVPDEGFSRIVKLHDKLYSNKLSHHHLLDISYIPHISIGNSTDVLTIKKIVDQWNEKEFTINGIISSLDIINYENRVVTTVERVGLG
jgi:hypothetical protein